jgi:quercetin dioxygenase-like cupin family protein/alkylhydroperoxidase/carboxymuconolactone decarboxylase family protein YurZ
MSLRKSFSIIAIFLILGGFMEINAQAVLTAKESAICRIAAFTAQGNIAALEQALNEGFDADLTINEALEICVHLHAYCGFPRCLNALSTVERVVNKRNSAGKNTAQGRNNTPIPDDKTSYQLGAETQSKLFRFPQPAPLSRNAPSGEISNYYLRAHLFGDLFARDILNWKTRELVTISALAAMTGTESQLGAHKMGGLNAGLTQTQIDTAVSLAQKDTAGGLFPMGGENSAFAKYFTGKSYLEMLTTEGLFISNVTFEPGCRNFWHIHQGGGQILLVTAGRGWYQEWGKPARELRSGDVVNIPAGIKHWHGAAKDSWFSHLAMGTPAPQGVRSDTEWLEEVSDKDYSILN